MNGASSFLFCVPSHVSRDVLWIHKAPENCYGFGCGDFYHDDGHSVYGICAALGSNEFVGAR